MTGQNDRARNTHSEATYFKSSVIKCADKSEQNNVVQIGRASYHHSEEQREATEGGEDNFVQVIFFFIWKLGNFRRKFLFKN